jgi:tryptophan-rich sensory protein
MAREERALSVRGVDVPRLGGSLLLCQLAGVLGAAATARSVRTWYPTLKKPSFNPPASLFGPVWTLLYLMMGLSLYLVSRRQPGEDEGKRARLLFAAQLCLNAAWSPAFFGLRSPALGLAVIVPMWTAIVATIRAFWAISRPAALLLLPYLLWVSFATVLNFSIWRMNR